MTHQPKHIHVLVDFALLEGTSILYLLISLYIGIFNVFFIALNWRRLRLGGLRGPLSMHICLAATPLFFIGENVWNQANILECKNGHWIKENCMAWKRVRNTLSAVSEALGILFFWFRSQTFYLNPILSGLFISNETKARVLNFSLLVLILSYPVGYTVYSVSNFWLLHHQFNYLVDHHLCYENYTNSSLAPIGGFTNSSLAPIGGFLPVNLTEAGGGLLKGLSELQHKDPVPMIVSTVFQSVQLLLHCLVIIPFLIPFIRFVRDQERDMPEVNTLLRRCLIVTVILLAVNIVTWVFGHLLAPVMPVSKFLLDAIADSRICVGIIMASSTMSNWRQVLMPWQRGYLSMFSALMDDRRQTEAGTESTVIRNTLSYDV